MQTNDIVFTCALAIIGYFLRDAHATIKSNQLKNEESQGRSIEEIGKLKGKIEMAEKQQANDIVRIEQLTQLKLENISKEITDLTKIVQQLVDKK